MKVTTNAADATTLDVSINVHLNPLDDTRQPVLETVSQYVTVPRSTKRLSACGLFMLV